ncbi:hypothetical protein DYY66_0999 [Candidatus Nitrosotalea sp. FS]|nr:hypothetical protein [Candidatus Nitrosotalea sp. FS]
MPWRRRGTRQRDQLGFRFAVKRPLPGRACLMPAPQNRLETLFDQLLAGAGDGGKAALQPRRDPAVGPRRAGLGAIGFQQNPRLHNPLRRVLALMDDLAKPVALHRAQLHHKLRRYLRLPNHDPLQCPIRAARESEPIFIINDANH